MAAKGAVRIASLRTNLQLCTSNEIKRIDHQIRITSLYFYLSLSLSLSLSLLFYETAERLVIAKCVRVSFSINKSTLIEKSVYLLSVVVIKNMPLRDFPQFATRFSTIREIIMAAATHRVYMCVATRKTGNFSCRSCFETNLKLQSQISKTLESRNDHVTHASS